MGNKVWFCKYGNIFTGREVVDAVCATQEVAMEWIRRQREQVLARIPPENVSELDVSEDGASFSTSAHTWFDVYSQDIVDSIDKLDPQ